MPTEVKKEGRPIAAAEPPPGKEIRINRIIPDDLPLEFADGMMIRNIEGGLFVLYFLQNRAPLAITPEEVAAVDEIDSICIAQIVLTADQLKKNMDAMLMNFQKYLVKLGVSALPEEE